jgi:hypothetical protein
MYSSDGSSNGTGIAAYIEAVSQAAFTGQGRPTHLTFGTYNSGGSLGERVRITDAGNVGIGTTSPAANLDVFVNSASDSEIRVRNSIDGLRLLTQADGTQLIRSVFNRGLIFGSGTSSLDATFVERMRIDSSGRLLIGTSSARANFINIPGLSAAFQVEGVGFNDSTASIIRNSANENNAPYFILGKTRSGSVGGATIVQNNDILGVLSFQGIDGSEFVEAATISAVVDGTPGANDMPGRLVFSTTADGTFSKTERMRINNRGHLLCGTTTDNTNQARVTVAPGPGSYNPDAGADLWKNCAVAGRGSFGGGLAVIQASGDGYTFYAAGTPSTLRVRYGADGGTATSNGVNLTSTATSWSANSDERLKTDLIPIEAGLEKASSLRAVTGRYLTDEEGVSRAFLIAQDVQAVLPEAVDQEGDEIGTLSLRYTEVIPLLVAALKESKERIETLEGMVAVNNITIDEQQHQLSTLAARLTALESA